MTTRRKPFSWALLGAALAIVVALSAAGCGQSADRASTASAAASVEAAESQSARPAANSTAASSTEPTFGPTGPTTQATVVRVTDGDTIVVAYGGQEHKVRYIGMDAPETVDPNSPVQWMGQQATAANVALVDGRTVVLEKDVSEVDRFGRLLRYVWLTDGTAWTLVNLELVRRGVASAISYPPDVKNDDLYLAAEGDAQLAAVGLWGPTPAPPTAAPTATPLPTLLPVVAPEPVVEEPDPEPAALAVKVTKRTASVSRGGTASITIKTAARAECSISVEYKSGPSQAKGLGSKTASSQGLISWSWKVGSNTTRGTWPIDVACSLGDRYGSASTEFTVK